MSANGCIIALSYRRGVVSRFRVVGRYRGGNISGSYAACKYESI